MGIPKTVVLPFLLFVAVSCGDSDSGVSPQETLTINNAFVSECGGFQANEKASAGSIPFTRDITTYSDSERLQWQYEPKSKTLKLMNSRISLNCCGVRTITAAREDGTIVICENDQPEEGGGRCRCTCVFDFYIEVAGVAPKTQPVSLSLTIDDTTTEKWTGSIDLSEGSGEVVIGK